MFRLNFPFNGVGSYETMVRAMVILLANQNTVSTKPIKFPIDKHELTTAKVD